MKPTAAAFLVPVFCMTFIIIGGAIAMGGLIWLFRTASFVSRSDKFSGQVIAMERANGSRWVYPVFTFTDSANNVRTQRSGISVRSFKVGERLTILCDPADSWHAEIDSFQTVWRPPLEVTGGGLLFGGFSWLMILLVKVTAKRGKSKKGVRLVR